VASPGDEEALRHVAHVIARHQMGPPTWAVATREYLDEIAAGYAAACTDETATFWLALRGDRVLAFQGYYPAEPADHDLLTPPDSIELAVAATVPEERGRGLMRLLTAHGLRAACSAGRRACTIDWRVTNLPASRFWPTQGFVPAAYRLARRVDPRIAPVRASASGAYHNRARNSPPAVRHRAARYASGG
jgi:ribosomal protein S18 acetylase RimI-like enzyme